MKHPNLLWEVRRADGHLVSCVLAPGAATHAVVQYVDETVSAVDEFDTARAARQHARLLYTDVARQSRAAAQAQQKAAAADLRDVGDMR